MPGDSVKRFRDGDRSISHERLKAANPEPEAALSPLVGVSRDFLEGASRVFKRLLQHPQKNPLSLEVTAPAETFLRTFANKRATGDQSFPTIPRDALPDVLDMALKYEMPEVTSAALRAAADEVVAGKVNFAQVVTYLATPFPNTPEVKEFLTQVARAYLGLTEGDKRAGPFAKVWDASLHDEAELFKKIERSAASTDHSPASPLTLADVRDHFIKACSDPADRENAMLAISLLAASPRPDDITAALRLLHMNVEDSTWSSKFTNHVCETVLARPNAARYAETCFKCLEHQLSKLDSLDSSSAKSELFDPEDDSRTVKIAILSNLVRYLEGANKELALKRLAHLFSLAYWEGVRDDLTIHAFSDAVKEPDEAHVALRVVLAELQQENAESQTLSALRYMAPQLTHADLLSAWQGLTAFFNKTEAWAQPSEAGEFQLHRTAFAGLLDAAPPEIRARWLAELALPAESADATVRIPAWNMLRLLAPSLPEADWYPLWQRVLTNACDPATPAAERRAGAELLVSRLPSVSNADASAIFRQVAAFVKNIAGASINPNLFKVVYHVLPGLEASLMPDGFQTLADLQVRHDVLEPNLPPCPSFPAEAWEAVLKNVHKLMHAQPNDHSTGLYLLHELAPQLHGHAARDAWNILMHDKSVFGVISDVMKRVAASLLPADLSIILADTLRIADSAAPENRRKALQGLSALLTKLDASGFQRAVDKLVAVGYKTHQEAHDLSYLFLDIREAC